LCAFAAPDDIRCSHVITTLSKHTVFVIKPHSSYFWRGCLPAYSAICSWLIRLSTILFMVVIRGDHILGDWIFVHWPRNISSITIAFVPLTDRNVYQFTHTEHKPPVNTGGHRSRRICWSPLWNLPLVNLLMPTIWRWFLDFWEICEPLVVAAVSSVNSKGNMRTSWECEVRSDCSCSAVVLGL